LDRRRWRAATYDRYERELRLVPALGGWPLAERLGHDIKTLMRTCAYVIRSGEDPRSIVDESLGVSADDWLRTG
jgi:hypothetical protein